MEKEGEGVGGRRTDQRNAIAEAHGPPRNVANGTT